MDKINIIIADDHQLIRQGIIKLLEINPKFCIIAETGNGTEALNLIETLLPDIAVLDIDMPGMNGVEICEKLKEKNTGTKVIILTMHKEIDLYKKVIHLDISGYILKEFASVELETDINSVFVGERYISKDIESLLTKSSSPILVDMRIQGQIDSLTKTEKTILLLVAKQIPSKDIAQKLFISEKTVKNHRHNIIKKLDLAAEQNNLLKYAIEHSAYL